MNKEARNGTQEKMQGRLVADELLEEIRALAFVKAELELFLDTHPSCRQALDYYRQTVDALEKYTERYQEETGPITASGVTNTEQWTWVNMPWPWQAGNGEVKGGSK